MYFTNFVFQFVCYVVTCNNFLLVWKKKFWNYFWFIFLTELYFSYFFFFFFTLYVTHVYKLGSNACQLRFVSFVSSSFDHVSCLWSSLVSVIFYFTKLFHYYFIFIFLVYRLPIRRCVRLYHRVSHCPITMLFTIIPLSLL